MAELFLPRNSFPDQKFVASAFMAKARAGAPEDVEAARNVVGPQVRRIRRQQRLSQAKLVLRCQLAGFDISRESLAKVEGGWRVVSDLEVLLLADALGVPFASLYPPPEKTAELVRSFRTV